MSRLNRARRRLHDAEGAQTIEAMFAILGIMALVGITLQIVVILISAMTVNHALAVASQEAAARGAVDQQVRTVFLAGLGEGTDAWEQCNDAGDVCLEVSGGVSPVSGVSIPGTEKASSGKVVTLSFTHDQAISLMGWLPGVPDSVSLTRSVQVGMQSLNH